MRAGNHLSEGAAGVSASPIFAHIAEALVTSCIPSPLRSTFRASLNRQLLPCTLARRWRPSQYWHAGKRTRVFATAGRLGLCNGPRRDSTTIYIIQSVLTLPRPHGTSRTDTVVHNDYLLPAIYVRSSLPTILHTLKKTTPNGNRLAGGISIRPSCKYGFNTLRKGL